ncbi:MAG: hypothetical protein ACPG8A_11940, partial [Psychrobium sp.]
NENDYYLPAFERTHLLTMILMMFFVISFHCCVSMFTVLMHTTIAHIAILGRYMMFIYAAAFLSGIQIVTLFAM